MQPGAAGSQCVAPVRAGVGLPVPFAERRRELQPDPFGFAAQTAHRLAVAVGDVADELRSKPWLAAFVAFEAGLIRRRIDLFPRHAVVTDESAR